ncbi:MULTISPECIES: helix-turn-helix domain-containing protein [unclassified Achromobacter]|uniref:helix-turn-helix domain-containing protein n=1 Tax=unclassified Achromobacter TaxID=2626865 RepID=UPI000B51D3D0|nr:MULTISPECIES: helix-turn-helix transcriptional regulator [unclassified Achromobacter]OWT80790.1 transcriptional regulator [Achromobacter sp. HZ34]OWT81306.1 transcriptional regulator [Achromobacter sp. HZ28]
MNSKLVEIGLRLRAYRMGAGLSAETLGERLNVSRASVYRMEAQGIGRLDVLVRVARLLEVPLETLLGVGVEYVASALAYFERLRQIEARAEHIFVAFGPIVYLLTSDDYDTSLKQALTTRTAAARRPVRARTDIDALMSILKLRKTQYLQRLPAITNVLSLPELVQFSEQGLDDEDANPAVRQAHRSMVRHELERVAQLLESPPMGVQVGILFDRLPTTSFSVIRQADATFALTSPFRVGPQLNVWRGVGTISQDAEALRLHRQLAADLWSEVLTGQRAAEFVRRRLLSRT